MSHYHSALNSDKDITNEKSGQRLHEGMEKMAFFDKCIMKRTRTNFKVKKNDKFFNCEPPYNFIKTLKNR